MSSQEYEQDTQLNYINNSFQGKDINLTTYFYMM